MNAKTAKSINMPVIPSFGTKVAPIFTFATTRVTRAAEFFWKGIFDTEMRITDAPGEYRDARSVLRDKYQYLGRTHM